MRLTHIILLFAVVFCLCGFTSKKEAERIFGNMTYLVGNERHADMVTLSNGKYYRRYVWDIYYDHWYGFGDFNHDGLRDAVAIIVVNPGGGNTNDYMLEFLINNGHKLVHRASYYLDNWAIINSLRVKNDKVVVDMYVHQKGDCNAGPSKRVRNVYAYSGQNIFVAKKKKA